jgi:hypothetical protein
MRLKHVNGTQKQKMNTKSVTFRKTAIRSGGEEGWGGGYFLNIKNNKFYSKRFCQN